MTLKDFVEKYCNEHQLAPSTEEQYRCTLNQFERVAGTPGEPFRVVDLGPDPVNRYIRYLEAEGRSKETVKGRRRNLLVLWREARRQGLNTTPDDCVRRVRSEELVVDVWRADEVRRLKAAATAMIGRQFPNGTDEGRYWLAYVAAGWDSGLRRGDLWSLPLKTIRTSFWWRQRKTGKLVKVELREATIDLLAGAAATGPKRQCPLALPCHCRTFSDRAAALIAAAGLTGTMKYLRRGCATDLCRDKGTSRVGAKKLGHGSVAITEKHYLPRGWDDDGESLLPEEL